MRHMLKAIPGAVLLSGLALAGCGSTSPSTASTASAFGTIQVVTPVIKSSLSGSVLPSRYTCDGKNVAPPIEWGPVPTGTKELAIILINTSPSKATAGVSFTAEWAIAGVNPELHKLASGQVPTGAVVGTAANGKPTRYSVCPKKGETDSYQMAVYALRPSFNPGSKFTASVLLQDVASGPSQQGASAGGGFNMTYKRK
jgi:phosphatidylethanolamine-binding protein (PEBP) family uncharacterized protein